MQRVGAPTAGAGDRRPVQRVERRTGVREHVVVESRGGGSVPLVHSEHSTGLRALPERQGLQQERQGPRVSGRGAQMRLEQRALAPLGHQHPGHLRTRRDHHLNRSRHGHAPRPPRGPARRSRRERWTGRRSRRGPRRVESDPSLSHARVGRRGSGAVERRCVCARRRSAHRGGWPLDVVARAPRDCTRANSSVARDRIACRGRRSPHTRAARRRTIGTTGSGRRVAAPGDPAAAVEKWTTRSARATTPASSHGTDVIDRRLGR